MAIFMRSSHVTNVEVIIVVVLRLKKLRSLKKLMHLSFKKDRRLVASFAAVASGSSVPDSCLPIVPVFKQVIPVPLTSTSAVPTPASRRPLIARLKSVASVSIQTDTVNTGTQTDSISELSGSITFVGIFHHLW